MNAPESVSAQLRTQSTTVRRSRFRTWLLVLLLAVAVVAGLIAWSRSNESAGSTLVTQPVEIGDLTVQRANTLSSNTVVTEDELDSLRTAVKRAEADLASARASVIQSRAAVETVETDLAKATIYSPIDGVVMTRGVEPGQTVAASFQAPVLFTIAEDLTEMKLTVKVDEADAGGVMGIALALSASFLLAPIMGIPFLPNYSIIGIALAFSASVGLVFGYFPARKAARLDPIQALRHE